MDVPYNLPCMARSAQVAVICRWHNYVSIQWGNLPYFFASLLLEHAAQLFQSSENVPELQEEETVEKSLMIVGVFSIRTETVYPNSCLFCPPKHSSVHVIIILVLLHGQHTSPSAKGKQRNWLLEGWIC